MSPRIPLALLAAAIVAAPVLAQSGADSANAVARIDTERRCIEAQRTRLEGALFRLNNARQTISSGTPGAADVTAAIRTAGEIEIEIRNIGTDISRCANPTVEAQPQSGTTPSNPQPVHAVATSVQRTQDGISSQRPVVEQGTPFARDRVLAANLKVVLAERLDAQGAYDDSAVIAGLEGVAPRVEACYASLNQRAGSIQRGDVQLYFTMLTNRRHPDGMRLAEFTIRDRTFQECVAHAVGQTNVATMPPTPIRYRVRLRFGP